MNPTQASSADHRLQPRFDVAQSVVVDAAEGTARNISAQGIYFVSPLHHEVGSRLDVSIEFQQGGQRHQLHCEGEVVRVEPRSDGMGIGARLLTPFFAE